MYQRLKCSLVSILISRGTASRGNNNSWLFLNSIFIWAVAKTRNSLAVNVSCMRQCDYVHVGQVTEPKSIYINVSSFANIETK